ncbi:methylation-associated defense system restriction endonuclease subunit S MAD5 [Flavobacterium lindanitolerans]|uniref:Restriction endonuclease S subunit n=1 Tax=Flavobacterium lindanitolerans TaxID=428988 RepID=A0A497V2V6_9FLAO|nr:restriction endonuclease subunit S [Flavobacterium lindanitolerans]PKW29644.1 restriction endonuclease S subunit [Flavobacterium lindanitolerans]RLJ34855.1 restriction endonuclease S subunit [Flavobacterium lindanitolerans]
MIIQKVKKQHIIESLRFDGSYHLSDGTLYLRKLRKMPHQELQSLCSDIFTAGRSKRIYTEKNKGLPYLSNSDVVKGNPLEGCKYNSKKYAFDEPSFLKEGMIVTGRVGAIGQTAYITSELEDNQAMGSDNIIRVVCKEKNISGYVYSFLVSRYGNTLLNRLAAGGVQPYISEDMLKDIPIPTLSKEKEQEIHQLIVEASELRVEANKLLKESQRHLFRLLNIDNESEDELTRPLEREVSNIFSTKRSALSANTFRSRNYSPRKQQIINVLKQDQYSKLKEVLSQEPFYGARYKRIESFSENSIMLLSQGDLFDRIPKGRSISKSSVKNLNEEIVSKGNILVPAQGTLGENEIFGRAVFVWGYLENTLVAGHAMRFIPNEEKIMAGYLFAVLNSPLWFRLFRNSVYGTNLLGFIVPLINELPVPRFSNEEEENIDVLVKTAYDNLTLANSKENQAIALIEKEIDLWQVS